MKTLLLLAAAVLFTFCLHAQTSRTRFSAGPELSIPTYQGIPLTGIGGSLGIDLRSKRKINATAEIGFDHFKGNVINEFNEDTIRGFSVMPVLGGIKFNTGRFYLAARGGLAIGLHNSSTSWALSPAVGILLPIRSGPMVDVGVRLIGVLPMPSFPENSFLNKGGYSYLNIRVAIVF